MLPTAAYVLGAILLFFILYKLVRPVRNLTFFYATTCLTKYLDSVSY